MHINIHIYVNICMYVSMYVCMYTLKGLSAVKYNLILLCRFHKMKM